MAERPTPEDPIRPALVTLAGAQPEGPQAQSQDPSGPSAPVLAGLALALGVGGFFLLGQLRPASEAPRPAPAEEGSVTEAAVAEGPEDRRRGAGGALVLRSGRFRPYPRKGYGRRPDRIFRGGALSH